MAKGSGSTRTSSSKVTLSEAGIERYLASVQKKVDFYSGRYN